MILSSTDPPVDLRPAVGLACVAIGMPAPLRSRTSPPRPSTVNQANTERGAAA